MLLSGIGGAEACIPTSAITDAERKWDDATSKGAGSFSFTTAWLLLMCFGSRKQVPTSDDIRQSAVLESRMAIQVVTSSNVAEMLKAHKDTFVVRKAWVMKKCPTITEVITRYPRYKDLTIPVVTFACCLIFCFHTPSLIFRSKKISTAGLPKPAMTS